MKLRPAILWGALVAQLFLRSALAGSGVTDLSGVVLSPTGIPIPGTSVALTLASESRPFRLLHLRPAVIRTDTDQNGHYKITTGTLRNDHGTLTVTHESYQSSRLQVLIPGIYNVVLAPRAAMSPCDDPDKILRGRIVSETGEAISGARIRMVARDVTGSLTLKPMVDVWSGEDGTFSLCYAGIHEHGDRVSLLMHASGLGYLRREITLHPPDSGAFAVAPPNHHRGDVVLPACPFEAQNISGSVRSAADGTPITGVLITMGSDDRPPFRIRSEGGRWAGGFRLCNRRFFADNPADRESPLFSMDRAAGKKITVTVEAPGYLKEQDILDPAAPRPLVFNLHRVTDCPAEYTVTGRVTDERGNFLAGARVEPVEDPDPRYETVTGSTGAFTICAYGMMNVKNRVTLFVRSSGFQPRETAIDLPQAVDRGLEIRLDPFPQHTGLTQCPDLSRAVGGQVIISVPTSLPALPPNTAPFPGVAVAITSVYSVDATAAGSEFWRETAVNAFGEYLFCDIAVGRHLYLLVRPGTGTFPFRYPNPTGAVRGTSQTLTVNRFTVAASRSYFTYLGRPGATSIPSGLISVLLQSSRDRSNRQPLLDLMVLPSGSAQSNLPYGHIDAGMDVVTLGRYRSAAGNFVMTEPDTPATLAGPKIHFPHALLVDDLKTFFDRLGWKIETTNLPFGLLADTVDLKQNPAAQNGKYFDVLATLHEAVSLLPEEFLGRFTNTLTFDIYPSNIREGYVQLSSAPGTMLPYAFIATGIRSDTRTIVHELGHHALRMTSLFDPLPFRGTACDLLTDTRPDAGAPRLSETHAPAGYVSPYSYDYGYDENFAETFSFFVAAPQTMHRLLGTRVTIGDLAGAYLVRSDTGERVECTTQLGVGATRDLILVAGVSDATMAQITDPLLLKKYVLMKTFIGRQY